MSNLTVIVIAIGAKCVADCDLRYAWSSAILQRDYDKSEFHAVKLRERDVTSVPFPFPAPQNSGTEN